MIRKQRRNSDVELAKVELARELLRPGRSASSSPAPANQMELEKSMMGRAGAPARKKVSVAIIDVSGHDTGREEPDTSPPSLQKSITKLLNGPGHTVERLAFEQDPSQTDNYAGIYRPKQRLLPDNILKRIAIQDDLVACIVQARCNQMSTFGRPRERRFDPGFVIELNKRAEQTMTIEEKKEFQPRIDKAMMRLAACGKEEGWKKSNRLSFSEWLYQSARNAIVVGRIATEVVREPNEDTGEPEFYGFRPIDAGTIYHAVPHSKAAQQVREQSRKLLEDLNNTSIDPDRFLEDEYAFIQVIDGQPRQAFSDEDCLVRNFYPVTDVELGGYPVTPLDTVISGVTTHINITTHNKLYFQSGRAARGMIVVQSEDADESTVNAIRQQFMASINSVSNAWRMPVFACGPEDNITWQAIDQGSRDMEFQYLSDMNARTILSAFQMSPEELPGWAYLSKGTNNQSLSESNNEYRLEAHRDLGIRPMIKQFEDFLNGEILPLIDAKLAKVCVIRLVGLDAETEEKESVRIQQDMPVHMTYNEVLGRVEKKPVPARMGGDFPLNPQWQAVVDKYVPVGQVLEVFFGIQGASKDPNFDYVRDPFFWQQREWQMQQQQMQQQAAMGQQGQPQQGGGDGGQAGGGQEGGQEGQQGGQDGQGEGQEGGEQQGGQDQAQAQQQPPAQDFTQAADQAIGMLQKSEHQLPPAAKRLLQRQRNTVDNLVRGLDNDLRMATLKLMEQVDRFRNR